jgi:hypothetical protein
MLDLDGAAPVILTREGKRLLTERAHALRGEVLPRLRAALEDPERDGRVDAEYERAVDELRRARRWKWLPHQAPTPAGSSPWKGLLSIRRRHRGPSTRFRDSGIDMGGGRHPTPASQQAVDAWVALGGGLGAGIGARLGNVFWIVIGAVAGLAIAAPEDGSPIGNHLCCWRCAGKPGRQRCLLSTGSHM